MTTIIVCAGGPSEEIMDFTLYLDENPLFIGADRGALHLLEAGIIPKYAVGDFDSVSSEEYMYIAKHIIELDKFRSEKNETDIELAVEKAMHYNPRKVIVTGVTGGRLDHMESALHLLYRFQKKYPTTQFIIQNRLNQFEILWPGSYRIQKNHALPFISFFAFEGVVQGLTLAGFKYPVENEVLEIGVTRFTSNELLQVDCTISFQKGICLMVRSSDG